MKFDMLKIGDKVKLVAPMGIGTVVTFFTDNQTMFVVYKEYIKHKKAWAYKCDTLEGLLYITCLVDNLSLEDRQELYKVNGLEYKRPM